MDFKKIRNLTFEEPDVKTFRNLALAMEALHKGGNLPCVLNAANEIAVYAFLRNRIGFLDMTDVIEQTMHKVSFLQKPSLEDYLDSDAEARNYAADLIKL
jgi:1-deoxy-D-xylulose-5-phosphate reductoisomerase